MSDRLILSAIVTLMLIGLALMTYSGAYFVAEWVR
jgi:hypothetical protein